MVLKKSKKPVETEKKTFTRSQPLSPKTTFETKETQFWKQVAEKSESLIADLIESVLPISATPQVFNLEKDADYRILLREDLPNAYFDNEEYQEKITANSWTEADVEQVSQELAVAYWEIVVKALLAGLSNYPSFESSFLSQWEE